ncbi:MAG: substrate-binding domain-containing protein [Clostridiaceae bacterium]|nr:substrate-binding domain-containing protein [Clostridiaceae bacterium]
MKKIITGIFAILILSLSISGFFYQNYGFTDSEKVKNVTIILKTQNDDYWKSVRRGANAAAKEFNVKVDFMAPDDENDINGQINLVGQAIDRGTDAIILAPIDYNQLKKITQKAIDKNIPVVAIDSKVNVSGITSFIATDNINAGKRAGEKLIELVGKNARIAIVNLPPDIINAKEREEGLKTVLLKYPEISVVEEEYDSSGIKGAYEITKEIIKNNGIIDGIITLDSKCSIGVAQAIDEMGLSGRIKLVAFDSTTEEIEFLEKGIIQSTVTQIPFSMGYLGVKNTVLKLQGKKIPKYIDTKLAVIDGKDMYLPENQRILFPFIQ